jgi:hypothetical protein
VLLVTIDEEHDSQVLILDCLLCLSSFCFCSFLTTGSNFRDGLQDSIYTRGVISNVTAEAFSVAD